MSEFIPVPGAAKAVISYSMGGSLVWSNTLWFSRAGGWVTANLQALADALELWLDGSLVAMMSQYVTVPTIQVYDMETETSPVWTLTPTLQGENTVNALPMSACCVVTFRTGQRGRSYRGRNYVSGWCEDQGEGNQLSAAVVAEVEQEYGQLNLFASAADAQHVVVSRYANKQARETGIFTLVTSVDVRSNVIGSQRRRNFRA